MDNPNITMEEYIKIEEEKKKDKEIEKEKNIDDVEKTDEVVKSKYIDVATVYPNDLKSNKDNDNDKVDIEHSSGDLSVKPLPDVTNTDVGAYAHGSNKLLETSHDTSNKFFKTETFIKGLNFNIMT
ncbi:hypothetical protein Tco_1144161 [Tanacetum coccineum]